MAKNLSRDTNSQQNHEVYLMLAVLGFKENKWQMKSWSLVVSGNVVPEGMASKSVTKPGSGGFQGM